MPRLGKRISSGLRDRAARLAIRTIRIEEALALLLLLNTRESRTNDELEELASPHPIHEALSELERLGLVAHPSTMSGKPDVSSWYATDRGEQAWREQHLAVITGAQTLIRSHSLPRIPDEIKRIQAVMERVEGLAVQLDANTEADLEDQTPDQSPESDIQYADDDLEPPPLPAPRASSKPPKPAHGKRRPEAVQPAEARVAPPTDEIEPAQPRTRRRA
ncbi:MAG: hypothetical protein SFZ23_08660 [Planctomycetota bacterium]|nr:hypothetical protein [Planctomycetota bacterium]